MIQVTLEFKSVDEAIVALGKLTAASAAPLAQAPEAQRADKTPTTAAVTKPTRRGRSDKGQARGPHDSKEEASPPNAGTAQSAIVKDTEASNGASSTQTATATAAPAEADKAQPSGALPATAVAAPTQQQCEKALEDVFNTKGLQAAMDVLSRFGVTALRHIKEDARAEFVAKCDAVLKGGTV